MYSAYLLSYGPIRLQAFGSREEAQANANATGGDVVVQVGDLAHLTGKALVDVYNAFAAKPVKKFETADVGRKRVFALIVENMNSGSLAAPAAAASEGNPSLSQDVVTQPVLPAVVAEQGGSVETTAEDTTTQQQSQEDDMANGKKASKKKAATGEGRKVGKPAKTVAELGTCRAGTARAKILKLMDGTKTAESIGKAVGVSTTTVMAHAFCLHRDVGVGYKLTDDGKLEALYPGQKTIDDVVVVPVKKEKKAAA